MKGLLAAAATAMLLISTADYAAAEPRHCPPGHAKKGWCEPGIRYDRDRRRDVDGFTRRDIEDELDRAYEEGYRDGREDAFRVGERLDRSRYNVLDRDLYYDRYGRRLDDRYYYAEADGERLLIEAATGIIYDILTAR